MRGAYFYQTNFDYLKRIALRNQTDEVRIQVTLRTDPNNKYDKRAIGIRWEGRLLGYVHRTVAYKMQWHINYLELRGMEIECPALVRFKGGEFDEARLANASPSQRRILANEYEFHAYVALPTVSILEKDTDWKLVKQRLTEVWQEAPDEIKSSLIGTDLYENKKLGRWLQKVRTQIPEAGIPDTRDTSQLPKQLYDFFQEQRMLRHEELTKKRREQIIEAINSGMLLTHIARQLHASTSTIKSVAQNAGLTIATSTKNKQSKTSRVDRCIHAVNMAKEGKTHKEIANILRVSLSTVEKLISDGRFYLEPNLYPQRVIDARNYKYTPWKAKRLSPTQKSRIKRDMNYLQENFPRILK
ncbi:hypothetical protein BSR28_05910 [Boudabousia liubingyangii]|nr:hypothetical protein BSR28_05910 [Boudabousia liubingyangii]